MHETNPDPGMQDAYVEALRNAEIEDAAEILDQFPPEDRPAMIETAQRTLDEAAPRRIELLPLEPDPRPDPNEPILEINDQRVAVSAWGEDEEPVEDAARLALKASRAITVSQRRKLDGRRLTVRDCRVLVQRGRASPRQRESRPAPPRRRSLARSSSRSGDSGSDSDDGQSDPSRRRLCAFCGADLPPKRRRYCTDGHADRDRQKRKRERDRARDLSNGPTGLLNALVRRGLPRESYQTAAALVLALDEGCQSTRSAEFEAAFA